MDGVVAVRVAHGVVAVVQLEAGAVVREAKAVVRGVADIASLYVPAELRHQLGEAKAWYDWWRAGGE